MAKGSKKSSKTSAPYDEQTPSGPTGFNLTPSDETGSPLSSGENPTSSNANAAGELSGAVAPTSAWQNWISGAQLSSSGLPIGLPGFSTTPGYLLEKAAVWLNDRGDSNHLDPTELNTRFPGLPKPFTEAHSLAGAQLIANYHYKRAHEAEWRANATPGSSAALGLAGELSSSLVGGLADPLVLFGGGLLGKGAKAVGLGEGLLTTYGANVGTMAALEAPKMIINPQIGEVAPTAGEVAQGSLAGAVLPTLIHSAFNALGKRGDAVAERQAHASKAKILEESIRRGGNDQPIDTGLESKMDAAKNQGIRNPGYESGYRFTPLAHPSDTSFYVAEHPDTGAPINLTTPIGEGFSGSDNPAVAHNFAGDPDSANTGRVTKFVVNENAKILSDSEPLESLKAKGEGVQTLKEYVKSELGSPESLAEIKSLFSKGTVSDLFDFMRSKSLPLDGIRPILKSLGYDGVHMVEQSPEGAPLDNRVFMFDKSKLTPTEEAPAIKEGTPVAPSSDQQAEARASENPSGSKFHDPDFAKPLLEGQKAMDTPAEVTSKMSDSNVDMESSRTNLSKIIEENPDDPRSKFIRDEMDQIDKEFHGDKLVSKTLKGLVDCISGSIA